MSACEVCGLPVVEVAGLVLEPGNDPEGRWLVDADGRAVLMSDDEAADVRRHEALPLLVAHTRRCWT